MTSAWGLIPWYIKYPAIGMWLVFKLPGWIGEKYDQRWEINAAPYRRERNTQLKNMEDDIKEIKEDTRDIKRILMEK